MERWVDISFDCIPLRSVMQLAAPPDASPKFIALCQRLREAIERHGIHNTYYLHHAHCTYRLANHPTLGLIEFRFEGTLLTDASDMQTKSCDLQVELVRETCDWLTQPIVNWLSETVRRSVAIEFDRYIEAGDLQRTKQRMEELQKTCDENGGFVGMYL